MKLFFNKFLSLGLGLSLGLTVSSSVCAQEGEEKKEETASAPIAQETEPTEAVVPGARSALKGMEERVSLDLRSTEVTDALKYLATRGGLNISISKNVSGRVNLFLTDVPIGVVFDLTLRSNELAYDVKGGVYSIMTETEYRALYGKKFSDVRHVETFRLKYAIPQQAFNLMDTLKSEVGRILIDEDSGTVLVMDTPERLEVMRQALATMEEQADIRIFDLKYAKAKDVEEKLKDQLEVNKLGFARADVRSNQILVKTLPGRMKDVEKLIEALDRKTREVLIDVKIVKVTLTESLNTGIDWDAVFSNLRFHGVDKKGDFRTAVSGTAPTETPAVTRLNAPSPLITSLFGEGAKNFGQIVFGTTVSGTGYELFRFLEKIGKTKLVSNPRILVTENQEAKILVGTKEAYITSTTTQATNTSTTAESVQFIDVGIQLAVTPQINRDGYVTMKIKPEVSSVVRTLPTAQKNEIPIVDTSSAETNVMVKDGTTVIIGGLRKDQKKLSNEHIPLIGRIPILGELFKQRDHDDELSELVVFITPHIVEGDELVTGDEPTRTVGIKDLRGYKSLLSDTEGQPPAQVPLPEGAPLASEPVVMGESPARLRLRDNLRERPRVN